MLSWLQYYKKEASYSARMESGLPIEFCLYRIWLDNRLVLKYKFYQIYYHKYNHINDLIRKLMNLSAASCGVSYFRI